MSANPAPAKVTLVLPPVQQAPPWKDLARCMGCSEPFNLLRRHHHCRHCGGDFCYFCCNQETQIPKFGYIVSQVRVCGPCYKRVRAEIDEYNEKLRPKEALKKEDRPKPPGWVYRKQCMACQVDFTTTVRDHHCRNCGRNFCEKCCSNFTPIPKYGWFLKQVRVCGPCLAELRAAGETNVAILQTTADGRLQQVAAPADPLLREEFAAGKQKGGDQKVKVYQNAAEKVLDVFGKKDSRQKVKERGESASLLTSEHDEDDEAVPPQRGRRNVNEMDALVHDVPKAHVDSVAAALEARGDDEVHYSIGDDEEEGLDLEARGGGGTIKRSWDFANEQGCELIEGQADGNRMLFLLEAYLNGSKIVPGTFVWFITAAIRNSSNREVLKNPDTTLWLARVVRILKKGTILNSVARSYIHFIPSYRSKNGNIRVIASVSGWIHNIVTPAFQARLEQDPAAVRPWTLESSECKDACVSVVAKVMKRSEEHTETQKSSASPQVSVPVASSSSSAAADSHAMQELVRLKAENKVLHDKIVKLEAGDKEAQRIVKDTLQHFDERAAKLRAEKELKNAREALQTPADARQDLEQ
eukprot:g39477.t1